ncbi:977_t:CDS:1, partial [Acaulospora morrowiae]
ADSDVILTNGTSTIDVNMTPQRIQRYFENVPLLMEIWQNNEQKNFQVGVATLRLEEVFLSQNTVDEVTKADIKTFTTLAPIKSVGLATSREMGHVSVSVRLEDYGEIESEGRSKHRSTLTKSHSTADLLDVSNDLHSSADESTTVESDRSSQHTKVSNKKKVEGDDCEQPLSKFRTDLFQQVGENMKLMRDVLASSKKNTKGQSFSKSKVQQMRTIDRQLQQSILYFQTRDESLLRAEKDFQRRWLELDRQHEKRRRETISRLEAEYAQKEKNLMQNNPINDTIKGLQAEVNSLKAQLDSTTRAQRHYESQWLRALQVLANTHDTESEEATIWKGLREMDQCWWQVRRMAEEEMEVLSYERL